MKSATRYLLASTLALGACGSDLGGGVPGKVDAGASPDAEIVPDANDDTGCLPPDFMVLLDRTGSMSKRPDGQSTLVPDETKWAMAVSTLESLTASREDSMRFGLTLFPRDPEGVGGDCSNLDTWLAEYLPPESNDPVCLPAEIVVAPSLGAASAIDTAIDRDTTGLCSYTPIGAGFVAAKDGLAAVKEATREQYSLLITDGADTCDSRDTYTTKSLVAADELRASGVKIFVVGFDGTGGGIDEPHLNHLACAGGTAPDFASNCVAAGANFRAIDSPSPARLFLLADDGVALGQRLEEVTAEVCCGCIE